MKLHFLSFPITGYLLAVGTHSLYFNLSLHRHLLVCVGILTLLSPLIWYAKKVFIYSLILLLSYLGGLAHFSQILENSIQ